jgi:hypothetical protein
MAAFCAVLAAAGYAIFLGAWFSCRLLLTSRPDVYLLMSLASGNKENGYGALYLQIIGSYASAPCLITWHTNNVQPHYRRATAVAVGLVSINIGGIVSSWIFIGAPRFHTASSINLAFSLGIAVASASLIFYLRARNTVKRKEVQLLLQMDGRGTGEGGWDSPEERRRIGDRHPRFEFTM